MSQQTPMKILVIDDDVITRKAIARLAWKRNPSSKVLASNEGMTGLEIFLDAVSQGEPLIVLLDLFMPDLNGEELLEVIGDLEAFEHVAVFILTGSDDAELHERVRRRGVEGVFVKHLLVDGATDLIEELERTWLRLIEK